MNGKIDEVCYYNALCNGSYAKTKECVKTVSYATIRKYVAIGKNLDFELRDLLEEKGKKKLSLGLALKFCEVPNPEYQYDIYKRMSSRTITNKEKIESFTEYTECNICCEKSHFQEKLPCCGMFVCLTCLYKTIDTMINDISFSGCKCPFCNSYFSKKYIFDILTFNRKNKIYKWIYDVPELFFKREYYRNLWRKMRAIIERVEVLQNKMIDENLDFRKLVSGDEKEKYYGVCVECCPPVTKNIQIFTDIKVNTVDRECADGEGNMVVLNHDMFKCENCGEKDNEYKKCPHCGIKTLRPSACNYVICGDHRWCWICNERLPNNHEGHNVHYWTGPGSSPYSNYCRRSIQYNAPDFVMDCCDCSDCSKHMGLKLCKTLECYNRCESSEKPHCKACQNLI